jgi:hypothetical protein
LKTQTLYRGVCVIKIMLNIGCGTGNVFRQKKILLVNGFNPTKFTGSSESFLM